MMSNSQHIHSTESIINLIPMLLKLVLDKQIHLFECPKVVSLLEIKQHIAKVFKKVPNKVQLHYIDEDGDKISIINDQDIKSLIEMNLKVVKIFIEEAKQAEYELLKCDQSDIYSVIQGDKTEIIDNSDSLDASQLNQSIPEPIYIGRSFSEKSQVLMDLKEKQEESLFLEKKEEKEEIQASSESIHEVRCDGCGIYPIIGVRFQCTSCPDFDLCQTCESKAIHRHHVFLKIRQNWQAPLSIKVKMEERKRVPIFVKKENPPEIISQQERKQKITIYILEVLQNQDPAKVAEFVQSCKLDDPEEALAAYLEFKISQSNPAPNRFTKMWIGLKEYVKGQINKISY